MIRRFDSNDDGSIVMAMLAIVVVTGLLTLGLATILSSHLAARHDVAFESALAGAERGLDELVAQAKANPTATSFSSITGTAGTGTTYSASATAVSGGWLVDSTGTARNQGRTITRHIQATVSIGDLLSMPLFGNTALNLGTSGPSAVDRYDSAVSSDVCTSSGATASMSDSDTRMCTHAAQPYGAAATDGPLTMRSADLSNMSGVTVFNVPATGFSDPAATGSCQADSGVQAACGTTIGLHHERLDYQSASVCSQGIGAGAVAYSGTTALAANAVYSFTDVTLNATAIANLANLAGSQIVICFNGKLTIPAGLSLNSTLKCSAVTSPSCTPSRYDPRPPSTLLLVSTGGGAPSVSLGAGSSSETSLSAVIYAPDADCTATGHVDVYGLLVCHSVNAAGGVDVHYDTEIDQLSTSAGFDRPVTVSGWHEL